MATDDGLRYIDSDGHILEHPTAMPDYAPAKYRDRIWHIETDEAGEEWLVYNGSRTPANGLSRGRRRRRERRGPGARRSAARCATPRPGPRRGTPRRACRTWTRTTSTWRCSTRRCCSGSRASATSTSPRRRPGPTTTGAPTTCRRARVGCSAPARCRRCTSPTTSARVAAEIRRVAELPGHGVGLHAAEPGGRLAAVQRPGLRPDLAGGGRHRPADRPPSVPRPRPARRVRRAAPGPAAATRTAATSTTSIPNRIVDTRGAARAPGAASEHAVHAGDRQPGRRDELHRVPHRRAASASGSPTPSSSSSRPTAAGSCRGWSGSTTTAASSSGRCTDLSMLPVGVLAAAVLDQLRPRRVDARASPRTRRWSAPTASSGRRDYPHPDAKFPGVTEELAEALDGLTFEQKRQITRESAIALYGIG